jgi:hypothetical protein
MVSSLGDLGVCTGNFPIDSNLNCCDSLAFIVHVIGMFALIVSSEGM